MALFSRSLLCALRFYPALPATKSHPGRERRVVRHPQKDKLTPKHFAEEETEGIFSRDASRQALRLGHTWSSLAPQRPPPAGMTLPSAPTPACQPLGSPSSPPPNPGSLSSPLLPAISIPLLGQTPDPCCGPRTSGQIPQTCSKTRASLKSSTRSARSGVTVTATSWLSCSSRRAGVQSTSWGAEQGGRDSGTPHSRWLYPLLHLPLPGAPAPHNLSISWRPPARWRTLGLQGLEGQHSLS